MFNNLFIDTRHRLFSPVWSKSITIIQRFHRLSSLLICSRPIRIQLQLCPTSSRSCVCCAILLQLMIISLVQALLIFITAAAASTASFAPTSTVNVTLPKHQSSDPIDAVACTYLYSDKKNKIHQGRSGSDVCEHFLAKIRQVNTNPNMQQCREISTKISGQGITHNHLFSFSSGANIAGIKYEHDVYLEPVPTYKKYR